MKSRALLASSLSLLLAACTADDGGGGAEGGSGGEAVGGNAGAVGGGAGAAAGAAGSTQTAGAGGESGGQAGGGMAGGMAGSAGMANVPDVEFGIDSRPANPTCLAPADPPTGMPGDPFPQTLADTGCFEADDLLKARPGVIPFAVSSALWSDAAGKRRWLALPDGEKITIEDDGDFTFPIGSVLIKEFILDDVLLETRFLYRHDDGEWGGYTYRWNDEGTEATLLGPATDFRFVGDLEWIFPSRENCLACHTDVAGRTIGPEIGQMNMDFVYAGTGRANQLKTLDHIGMFEVSPGNPANLTQIPDPTSMGGTVETRARAYLHANCAHCHRPGGAKETLIDLRFETAFADTNTCDIIPAKGQYGLPNSRLILPGNVDESILRFRINSTVQNVRMPAIGTALIDTDGVAAVDAWIDSLQACPQ